MSFTLGQFKMPTFGEFSKRSSRATFTGFFDRPEVIRRLERKQLRVLSRTGGFARKTARRRMKEGGFGERQRFSKPGQSPRFHTRRLKDLIFYALESNKDSVVIGPVSFQSQAALALGAKTGAQLLEEGGIIYFPRRKKTGRIDARPYMAPTMQVAEVEFRKLMKEVPL